jgi:hypothetical protein
MGRKVKKGHKSPLHPRTSEGDDLPIVGKRSWVAMSALSQNGGGPMKDRRAARGGSRNTSRDYLDLDQEEDPQDQGEGEAPFEEERNKQPPLDKNCYWCYWT